MLPHQYPILNCKLFFVNYDIQKSYQFLINNVDNKLAMNTGSDIIALYKWLKLLKQKNHRYLYSVSHFEHYNSLDNFLLNEDGKTYDLNLTGPKLWCRLLIPEFRILNYKKYKSLIESNIDYLIDKQIPFLYDEDRKWHVDTYLIELINEIKTSDK